MSVPVCRRYGVDCDISSIRVFGTVKKEVFCCFAAVATCTVGVFRDVSHNKMTV